MPIERLDHIAMLTPDVERAKQFYCAWAGMRVIHDRQDADTGHRVAWVRLADDPNGLVIVMVQSNEQRHEGRMDHFGFHVSSRADVDAIAERARAENILVEEPQYAGPVVGYYCMIKDPDGNLLEFSCEQLKA
jgi:catechol 2,3-dioxygenase-like lactoylglutathione lyase family enzyme